MEVKQTELSKSLNIVYQPHPITPTLGRQGMVAVVEDGTTVREILLKAGVDPHQPLVISLDDRLLTVEEWDTVCPTTGQLLNVQASVQGGGGDSNPMQMVLMVAVVVAAAVVAGPIGAGFASSTFGVGAAAGAAIAAGAGAIIAIGGSLLIGALFPPKNNTLDGTGNLPEVSPTYSLSGGSNQIRPYQSMPVVMGTHRLFPDLASKPYTEYRGEDQYLYQIFHLGLGNVSVSDWKIGTTPITSYEGYQFFNSDGNGKLTGFPGNVDTISGASLTQAAGWIQRTTSTNTYRIGIDIEAILYSANNKGGLDATSVEIEIEYKPTSSGVWLKPTQNDYYFNAVTSASNGFFTITAATQKPQRGTIYINVASGEYDVRIRRLTADTTDPKVAKNTNFSTLRSYQEDTADYKGQTRIGLSIKASEQLNGVVQQLSATVTAGATYWNGSAWVFGYTSNPAHWYMHFARGVYNTDGKLMYGVGLTDSQIDIAALHSWAQFCSTESLTFNAVLDGSQTAADVLNAIARAGFGSPSWASGKLGVVYDAREASPVMSFGMSNIIRNSFEVVYITERLADEIVVRFRNPDKDWEQDEVRATAPGVTDPENISQVELYGCTNATMAGKFANYLAAQQYYRKRRITWQSDFEGFVCQRGDVVLLSHDLTQWGYSGRIVNANGLNVTLDRKVPRSAGGDYLMLIRPDGQTHTYNISGATGDSDTLILNIFPGFQSGYSLSDHRWCYSPLATPGKKVKIISIAPASDSRLQIVATDEYPEFYDAWGGTFVPPPDSTVLPQQPVTVTNLSAVNRTAFVDGVLKNRVALSWGVGGGVLYSRVRIYFDGTLVAEQSQNLTQYYEIDFEGAGAFYAEVTPFGISGAGVTQSTSLNLAALDLPSAPTNLQLYAGESSLSATYTWDAVLGVQSYVIAIYVGGVAKRIQNIGNSLSYTYTLDEAKADGGAFRQYEFRVYSVNQVGQSSSYASVTFSNQQIAALANARIEPMPNSLWFRCDKPTEPDFQAIRIWVSKTSGFTPSSTTVVYDGADNWVNIAADNDGNPLESGVVYYLRAAGYDSFGDDNLTYTGEFSATVLSPAWGLLQDDIETSMLEAGLRDRIDLIDTSGAPDMPNGLIDAVRRDATDISVLNNEVDTLGEKLLESALKIQDNTDLLYDAGVTVDSTTGEVYIYGVRQAEDRLDSAEIRLDAAEANINLRATTIYVDNAIATAVIDPSQIAELGDLQARIGTAEVDIDGLQAAVTLKADLVTVNSQGARLTSAEADIDALEGQIVLKANNTDLTTTNARVTSVETTLDTLDIPGITQTVTDVRYLSKNQDQIAETQLKDILTGQANYESLDVGIASATNQLTAYVNENLEAEAAQRLALQVQLEDTAAALEQESIARATADNAEAAQRLALAARVDVAESDIDSTQASVVSEAVARANADSALSSTITALQSTVNNNNSTLTAAIQSEATTRANNDTAISNTVNSLISTVNTNNTTLTAAINTEATTRANADSALSSQITTLTSTVNANTAAIQSEANTRASADNALSSSISTLQTTVNGNTTSIQTVATSVDGIQGKYAVKIDNNGYVSGYGLISTANNATPFAEFAIIADRFSIAPVATNPTAVDGSPFFVITSPTVIGGVTVPAGTYMKAAYIHDATITTAKIADAAITNAKILDATIQTAKIADATITTAKIQDATITTAKIQDAAITTAKIQDASISTAKIIDGSINNAKIGTAAITEAKIADGNITNAKIANGSITNAKIGDAQITGAKIATATIGAAQIADGNITNAKIQNGAIDNAKIGDAQITTAKIGVAQVDTLRIAGSSVTVTTSIATNATWSSMYLYAPYGGVITVILFLDQSENNRSYLYINGGLYLDIRGVQFDTYPYGGVVMSPITGVAVVGVGGGNHHVQVYNTGNATVRAVALLTQR